MDKEISEEEMYKRFPHTMRALYHPDKNRVGYCMWCDAIRISDDDKKCVVCGYPVEEVKDWSFLGEEVK